MLCLVFSAQAKSPRVELPRAELPKVPEIVRFADMRLELTADARKKVQTDVDALTT